MINWDDEATAKPIASPPTSGGTPPALSTIPIPDVAPGVGQQEQVGPSPLQALGDFLKPGLDTLDKSLLAMPIGAYKGIEHVMSRVPLGWLPGGADDNFNQIGEWLKQNDPSSYANWQNVKATSDADFLFGGNMKADFNMEAMKKIDELSKSSQLGWGAELALGRGGVGSLGGAFANAVKGFLGAPSAMANEGAAATGLLGQGTDRLQRIVNAYNDDPSQLHNPAELKVAEMLTSGKWDEVHAVDYLIREGAGYSENPFVNMTATMILDPTTWTPMVAGKVAKLGEAGGLVARSLAAGEAAPRGGLLPQALRPFEQQLDDVRLFVHAQQSGKYTGRIYQFARASLGADPLGAYAPKPQAADAASIMDIQAAHVTDTYYRAYNPVMVTRVQQRARDYGIADEVDQLIADSANYQFDVHLSKDAATNAILEDARIMGTPDEFVDLAREMQSKSQIERAVETVTANKVVPHTPAQLDDLAARIAKMAGMDKQQAARDIAKMSEDERAVWWDVTYTAAARDIEIAKQAVDPKMLPENFPLDRAVLMNENSLSDVEKTALLSDIRGFLAKDDIQTANAIWDGAVSKYPQLGHYGVAKGGRAQLQEMLDHLEKYVEPMRTATPEEEAVLGPLMEVLARNENDGKQLYRIGFRPSEEDAWGLAEDPITGRLTAPRQPMVARRFGTQVAPPKFHDTVRNSLGQIIGKRAADKVTRPIESLGALFESQKDNISGRRVVLNWQTAFSRGMEAKGVPKAVAEEIFTAIAKKTQSRFTTIRAARPDDMGAVLRDLASGGMKAEGNDIPYLLAKDGTRLSEHDILDVLLTASKGDFRILGLGTGLTQRMRNMVRAAGLDNSNNLGEWTITQYLNIRYRLNPMFATQRALEGPYYAVVYGTRPIGRTLPESLKETELFMRNLGSTTVGRDFALDQAEYAVRSNFGLALADELARLNGGARQKYVGFIQKVMGAADPYVRNNMISMAHGRLGSVVRGLLDNVAEMEAKHPGVNGIGRELGILGRTFEELGIDYSKAAGKTLTDDEVGLKYIQELFSSSRRMRATENGIDVRGIVSEQAWMSPSRIGEIGTLHPDNIAVDLGFQDLNELRRAVTTRIDPSTGRRINTQDMPGIAAKMRAANYHPDVIRRLTGLNEKNQMVNPNAYFANTWDGFWDELSRPFGEAKGAMDISPHAAEGAKDLIRYMAKQADMEPWEYLSAVVGHNVGGKDLKTVMGEFVQFLQGNAKAQPLRAWIKHFNSIALQESGARALLDEYEKAIPGLIKEAEAAGDMAKVQALKDVAAKISPPAPAKGQAISETLFHGSPTAELQSISADPAARQFDNATSQFGAFATPDEATALKYAGEGGTVYKTGSAPKNAYRMSRKEFDYYQSPNKGADGAALPPEQWAARAEELKAEAAAKRKELADKGYDGVLVPGNRGNPTEVASFSDVDVTPYTLPVPKFEVAASSGPGDDVFMDMFQAEMIDSGWSPDFHFDPSGTPNSVEKQIVSVSDAGAIDFYESAATPTSAAVYLQRDASGGLAGYAVFPLKADGTADAVATVVTRPSSRRMGVATNLYDAAEADGLGVRRVTGRFGVTSDGEAFSAAYTARKAEAAPPVGPAMEEIPHDYNVVARATTDATKPVKPGQKAVDVYHYVVSKGDQETLSTQTYPTALEAIDAGQLRAQEIATESRKALGEPWQREVSLEGREATRVYPAPEGFTDNPVEIAGAGGHTFDPELKREGLFHVTVSKDAFVPGKAHPGDAPAGIEGFGSKGDTANAGRTSILMDKASSDNYLKRITLAVDAAQGNATVDDIVAHFKPVYEKAYGDKAAERMKAVMGGMDESEWAAKVVTPQQKYRMTQALDNNLVGAPLPPQMAAAHLTTPFESAVKIDRSQIATVRFAANKKASVVRGLDKTTGEVTIAHGDLHTIQVTPLEPPAAAAVAADGATEADQLAFKDVIGEAYDDWFEKEIVRRIKSGKPHANPNIEAIARGLSDWTKQALTKTQSGQTRKILNDLVEKVPGEHGVYWNRSEALVHQVARSKIKDIEHDVFRLAEMQTTRTSIGRSINHPVFGFYPASYMWGKVFPETVKFLTKSPYGVTYDILKVQALIAAQRDASPDFESQMGELDRSTVAFLLGYLTPSLPWEEQQIRTSALFRELANGVASGNISAIPGAAFRGLNAMMNFDRGFKDAAKAAQEVGGFVQDVVTPDKPPDTIAPDTIDQLQSLPSAAPTGAAEAPPTGQNKGPVKGTELEPVLVDSMSELLDALR